MVPRTIVVEPYGLEIHLCYSSDLADYTQDVFGLRTEPDPKHSASLVVLQRDDGSEEEYVLSMPREYRPEIVAHECLHAAWRVLDWVDVKVTADNHECLAYHVQHLVQAITTELYDS